MMTCSFDAHAKAALHRAWQDWAEVESQSGGFSDTGDVDVDQPCAGIVQPTHPAEVLRAAWENIRQGLCKQRDGDLNVKQAACHLLFALRLALLLAPGAEKTSPQSCIVLGGPGTGKTYILNLNAQLLERFCPDSAVSCAFMNAAARLVQGTTLHAAFDLRLDQQYRPSESALRALTTCWLPKRILRIDEISMVSAELLSQVETAARLAKQNSRPQWRHSAIAARQTDQLIGRAEPCRAGQTLRRWSVCTVQGLCCSRPPSLVGHLFCDHTDLQPSL